MESSTHIGESARLRRNRGGRGGSGGHARRRADATTVIKSVPGAGARDIVSLHGIVVEDTRGHGGEPEAQAGRVGFTQRKTA
jgi:hypothetical protein